MSMFRSADMMHFQIHIPKEYAYEVVSKLGNYNFVQFIDAAAQNFHKPYYNSVKRCQEIIHKVDIILQQIKKEKIQLPSLPDVEKVYQNQTTYLANNKMNTLTMLDHIEEEVENKFVHLEKLKNSLGEFSEKVMELEDYKFLLFKSRQIFHSKKGEEAVNEKVNLQQLHLLNISGIIQVKDMSKFTKMIFRASKGNNILYTFNVPHQITDKTPARAAFIIILEAGGNLLGKVNRICETFGAKRYKIPNTIQQMFQKIRQIEDSITDTKQLAIMTDKNYQQLITECVHAGELGYPRMDTYRILVEKQSLIFHTMNYLESSMSIMIAKIWLPEEKKDILFEVLPSMVSIRQKDPEGKPPTFYEMTEFTAPFQQIVNTYGVPRYKEINPALYAIPVFPFYFGVMFGDIGHGGVLLAFALWLIFSQKGKKLLPDIYNVRYLFLLMGSFAFYSGWIYNQFFSIPLNLFGSCYGEVHHEGQYAHKEEGCVYPFGFDPKWIRSSNQLNYFNSYKMKFAVIIGVFHMTFAIFLKMLNTYHFRNYIDLFFQWLPQQIFFFCTFGYMSFLIIFKWTLPWGTQNYNTAYAPSIIGQMIALPLQLGSTQNKPLWDKQSQQMLQYKLLMIALICVPWMLIPKVAILWAKSALGTKPHQIRKYEDQNELDQQLRQSFSQNDLDGKEKNDGEKTRQSDHAKKPHDSHEDISEIAVHQIIETIQFVLSTISNTASYLRLWALSLAHGQLSKVFLSKTIGDGIQSANIPVILVGMYFFFSVTLGVIMGMDVMECFLHALRLQWVQFQSKFFKADGWKFAPLSFIQPVQAKMQATRADD